MKFTHTLFLSLLVGYTVFGQNKIESTGNVGIGTTSPTYKMEWSNTTNTGFLDFTFEGNAVGSKTGNLGLWADGSEQLTISKSGNVGIGTTSPSTKLEVAGVIKTYTTNVNQYLRMFGGNSGNFIDSYGTDLYIRSEANNSKSIVLKNNGDVGIGTNLPNSKLEVSEGDIRLKGYNTSRYIRFAETENNQGSFINYDGTNNTLNIGVHETNDNNFELDINAISIVRSTANVGIGTSTPKSKLHVLKANVNNGHYLNTANVFEAIDSRLQILSSDLGNASSLLFLSNAPEVGDNKHWSFHHTGVNRNDRLEIGYGTSSADGEFWDLGSKMTILTNGNVGIGTTDPRYKFHVIDNNVSNSHYLNTANVFENKESRLQILAADTDNASAMLFLSSAPEEGNNKHWGFHHTGINRNDRLEIGYSTSTANGDFWDLSPKMTISTNGDVGIGTTDTKGFKLGVNGDIAATKIKVALYDNWPDYVFEDAYELPSLKEVEAHINEKGHLQNVPSAKEVGENGFFLEEMDSKLLQKIEELTLYTIEQEKKIELLMKRLEKLEAK